MADDTGSTGARPDAGPTPEGARPDGQQDATGTREASGSGSGTDSLSDSGREALDRERTARREAERRANDIERQLQQLQDAGKSELERAQSRAERAAAELENERAARQQLEAKVLANELLELKRSIAIDMGVPIEAAHRLQGTDTRSIKADAQRYLEERAEAEGHLGVGRGGTSTGRSGADMNTLIRQASGRPG